MPYRRINDPEKLRRLMAAVLMIAADVEPPRSSSGTSWRRPHVGGRPLRSPRGPERIPDGLEQFLTVGLSDEEEGPIGPRPTGRGVLGLLITDPQPLRLADLATHPDSYGFPPNHPPMTSFLGVPVRVRDEVYGNLYLTDKEGAAEFSEEDEALAEALALAAGIAIQNHRLHDRVRVVSLLDDRDRIARDLHDRVIQRIFAVGMSLQGAARLPDMTQMASRVDKAVDELDATIAEIRTAIFELGAGPLPGNIRQSVLDMVKSSFPPLGFVPKSSSRVWLDTTISENIGDHLLAVLREGLTNASKHAKARAMSSTSGRRPSHPRDR